MTGPRPLDGRDAMYAGWVAGLAISNGLDVVPVLTDDGRYTDHIEIRLPLRPLLARRTVTVTLVVGPAPPDWNLTDDGVVFIPGADDA